MEYLTNSLGVESKNSFEKSQEDCLLIMSDLRYTFPNLVHQVLKCWYFSAINVKDII